MDSINVSGNLINNNEYEQLLSEVEDNINSSIEQFKELESLDFIVEKKLVSVITSWDYCFAIAIGLAGVFVTTSKQFEEYLNGIHRAASGSSGNYDALQTFLGKTLKHSGDNIDTIDGVFINRNNENAYGLFHRLLWGHDILSIQGDNPFNLMLKQKGFVGLLQASKHLIADTTSKQGLPLPGSSYFDYVDANKTSNYLIDISQDLSNEAFGNKNSAQEIYSHMFTIRGQDLVACTLVKSVTKIYCSLKEINDKARQREIELIAYVVNFLGEAAIGSVRQNGVPYINIPLAMLTISTFIKFYKSDKEETKLLNEETLNTIRIAQEFLDSEEDYSYLGYNQKSDLDESFNNCDKQFKKFFSYIEEEMKK